MADSPTNGSTDAEFQDLSDREDAESMATRASTLGPNPSERYVSKALGWIPFTETERGTLEIIDTKTSKPHRVADNGNLIPCTKPLCPACSTSIQQCSFAHVIRVEPHLISDAQRIDSREGWMGKLGGKLRPLWQDRFFIANERALYYYDVEPGTQQEKQKPKGSKKFLHKGRLAIKVIEKPSHKECSDESMSYFGLEFRYPPQTVYFRSNNADVIAKWVAFFEEVVRTLSTETHIPNPCGHKTAVDRLLVDIENEQSSFLDAQKRLNDIGLTFQQLRKSLVDANAKQFALSQSLQERRIGFNALVSKRTDLLNQLDDMVARKKSLQENFTTTNARMEEIQTLVDRSISECEAVELDWITKKQSLEAELAACRAEINASREQYKVLFEKTRKVEETPSCVNHVDVLRESLRPGAQRNTDIVSAIKSQTVSRKGPYYSFVSPSKFLKE